MERVNRPVSNPLYVIYSIYAILACSQLPKWYISKGHLSKTAPFVPRAPEGDH